MDHIGYSCHLQWRSCDFHNAEIACGVQLIGCLDFGKVRSKVEKGVWMSICTLRIVPVLVIKRTLDSESLSVLTGKLAIACHY